MKTITRKSLLYRTGVEYSDFCLNHVQGCSHGCKYPCYAFMMKKRCGVVKTYEEWIEPKIVENALELLDVEIPKYKKDINYVHMCFSTDPFMFEQDEVSELSLQIMDKLNSNDIPCSTLTKGVYPKELAKRNGKSKNNKYGITLVSLDEEFRKKYEPKTATFKERIKSLKNLHDSGFQTWVSMEPYPTPNFIKQNLKEVLDAVGFVDKIVFGRMNYNAVVSEFKFNKEYYNSLSSYFVKFCKENEIGYHVKEGTKTPKVEQKYSKRAEIKQMVAEFSPV